MRVRCHGGAIEAGGVQYHITAKLCAGHCREVWCSSIVFTASYNCDSSHLAYGTSVRGTPQTLSHTLVKFLQHGRNHLFDFRQYVFRRARHLGGCLFRHWTWVFQLYRYDGICFYCCGLVDLRGTTWCWCRYVGKASHPSGYDTSICRTQPPLSKASSSIG